MWGSEIIYTDKHAVERLTLLSTNESFSGRDTSVGITTRFGLEGPGIESRCWRDFPHASSLLYNEATGFPGGKAAGAWR